MNKNGSLESLSQLNLYELTFNDFVGMRLYIFSDESSQMMVSANLKH